MRYRTSASNCATFYNTSFGRNPSYSDVEWPFQSEVRTEHVWDAFTLYGLLDYHTNRNERLVLPHTRIQDDRFDDAMKQENDRKFIFGLGDIHHHCKKCTNDADGKEEWGNVPDILCLDRWLMVMTS